MNELIKLLIGIVVLLLAIPLGNFLARQTKEELKDGQKWFKLLIAISLIGAFTGMLIGNDFILFSFLFIAIISLRSIKGKRIKIQNIRKSRR